MATKKDEKDKLKGWQKKGGSTGTTPTLVKTTGPKTTKSSNSTVSNQRKKTGVTKNATSTPAGMKTIKVPSSSTVKSILNAKNGKTLKANDLLSEHNRYLTKLDMNKATPVEIGESMNLFWKAQAIGDSMARAGENVRVGVSVGPVAQNNSITPGESLYGMNDAINQNTANWLEKFKQTASEDDIRKVLDIWKTDHDQISDQDEAGSKYRTYTQRAIDDLTAFARNRYSSFAEEAAQDSLKNMQGAKERMKAGEEAVANTATSEVDRKLVENALNNPDPLSAVRNDANLRRILNYDTLERRHGGNEDALFEAVLNGAYDYLDVTAESSKLTEEAYARLLQANDALAEEASAYEQEYAKWRQKADELKLHEQDARIEERFSEISDEDWQKYLQGKLNIEPYEAVTENRWTNPASGEEGINYTYNTPAIEQIVADPEAVSREYARANAAGITGSAQTIDLASYMEPVERNTFFQYYRAEGPEAAEAYFKRLESQLLDRQTKALVQQQEDLVNDGGLNAIGANVAAFGYNVLGNAQNKADAIRTAFGGEPAQVNQFGEITQAIDQTTQQNIIDATPWANFNIGGRQENWVNWLYSGGKAVGNELVDHFMFGALSPVSMAVDAGAKEYVDTYNETGDRERALAAGAGTALPEYLSEKMGFDWLGNARNVDALGGAARYVLGNAVGEGFEEVISQAGETALGALAGWAGPGSEVGDRFRYLTENGYDTAGALGVMAKEFGIDALENFAVGTVAGGAMSGANAAIVGPQQAAYNTETGRQIEEQGNLAAVLEMGLKSPNKGVQKLSQGLMDKLNLTDPNKPVLPEDAKTKAEVQLVTEAVQEQKAADTAKQQANNQQRTEETMREPADGEAKAQMRTEISEEQKAADAAKQQQNNQKKTEEKMRPLSNKEARQVGRLYNDMLHAMDVQVGKDKKALEKAVKKRIAELGSVEIDEVVEAIASVAMGEPVTQEQLDLAEAAAMKDGPIKEIADAMTGRANSMARMIRAGFTKLDAEPDADAAQQGELRAEEAMPRTVKKASKAAVSYTTDAGDEVAGEIEGFAASDNGEVMAVVNGETVPVDKLEISDEGSDMLIRRGAQLQNAEAASAMYDSYEEGQDVEAYTLGFEAAYHYGEIGTGQNKARSMKLTSALTDGQFKAAYVAGASAAAARPRVRANQSGGKVSFAGDLGQRLNELDPGQRSSINALSRIAEIGTVNIEFFQSRADESGSYMGSDNGWYDPSTNTIHIDVNAGKNSIKDANSYALLRVAAHELTHYIKAQNTEGYKALQDFVVEQLTRDNGLTFDGLVARKIEIANARNRSLSYEAAVEEVVADGCEMMLKNSAAIQQLAQENRGLFKRVRRWLRSFAQSVQRAFRGVSEYSDEAWMLKDVKGMQKLWDDALVGAMESVQKGQEASGTKAVEAAPEGEKKSSPRNYDVEISTNEIESNIKKVVEMKNVVNLVGNEFKFGDGNLKENVTEYFKEIGGKAYNPTLGDVELTKSSYKDDLGHGMTPLKAVAFRAVPDVIEKGKIIDYSPNWEGRNYRTYVIAAPISIKEGLHKGEYWLGVVAKADKNMQRLYTHEAVLVKKEGFNALQTGASAAKAGDTGGTKPSLEIILQKLNEVKYGRKDAMYSTRTDDLTDRDLLRRVTAEDGQNSTEQEFISKYLEKTDALIARQEELEEIRSEIRKMQGMPNREVKEDKDYLAKLNRLKVQAGVIARQIERDDRRLQTYEQSASLKKVLAREREWLVKYQKAKARGIIDNRNERRKETETRQKIRRMLDRWDSQLKNPTKTKYVPRDAALMVIAAREMVNTDNPRASDAARAKAREKIASMKSVYDRYKSDPAFAYAYDETISEMMENLQNSVGEKSIYQLSGADLQAVYNMLTAVQKQLSEAAWAKTRKDYVTIMDWGRGMYRETLDAAPVAKGRLGDYLNWQLTPDKFFARLAGYKKDSEWSKAGKAFSDGTQKMLEIQRDAYYHFRKWTESKQFDKLNDMREKSLIDIGLRDADGNAVKITRGMMLEVYMHLLGADNRRGFMYGGFSVPNMKKYYAGKVAESYGTGSVNTFSELAQLAAINERMYTEELSDEEFEKLKEQRDELTLQGEIQLDSMKAAIEEKLTDWDRGLIQAVREWNDGKSRDYINDVTMDLYGLKRAGVQNYYPIHRDTAFVDMDFASISRNMNLENWGSLKARVPSRAPLLLGDIAFTLDNSIKQMSRYVGYARAQRDFGKLYNVRMPGMTGSVKKIVGTKFGTGDRALGASGEQYIENYIGSITGSRHAESDFLSVIRRNLPRATMSLNYRVGLSQLSALPKAAVEVGWGNLAKGMAHGGTRAIFSKKAREELAKKNVWFWQRYQGEGGQREFADAKGGRGPIDRSWNWIDDHTGGWLLNLNQKMDVAATVAMWSSAEAWVQENRKDLRRGSEAYNNAVNDKYTDILRNTQAANTVSERSDLHRQGGLGYSILTMYKSEAFANFNIMYDAAAKLRKYKADLKAGKNGVTQADVTKVSWQLANSITSVVIASSALNAAIKLLVNALFSNMSGYRDEDDEVTKESIAASIGKEMVNDFVSMAALGSQVYDFVAAAVFNEQYYAPSYAAMEEITNIAKSTINLIHNDDKTGEDYAKWAEKLFYATANMLGIPAKNAVRQAEGLKNTVLDIGNGEFLRFEASTSRTNSTNLRRLADAELSGDAKKWETVYKELAENYKEKEDEELTEKEFNSMFKSYVGEKYKDGVYSREEAERLLKNRTDLSDAHELFWQMDKWDYGIENGSQEGYAEYNRLEEAVATAKSSEIKNAKKFYTQHGKTEADVVSQIKTIARDLYCEGELTWNQGIGILIEHCNSADADYDYVHTQYWEKKEWDYAKAHDGKLNGYGKYSDFYAATENGRDASKEVEELFTHAPSRKKAKTSAMNSISGRYKNKYIDAVAAGNTKEAERIMEMALNAYEAIGLSRESQRRYILKNWKDDK